MTDDRVQIPCLYEKRTDRKKNLQLPAVVAIIQMSTQHQMRCNFSTTDDILFQSLRIYQTSRKPQSANAEIIQSLEDVGVLNFPSNISVCLLPSNCEVLADAFMYLPKIKLKKAMYCAFQDRVFSIFGSSDVERFIFDRELPEGLVWTVFIKSDPLLKLWYFCLSQLRYFPCLWWTIWTTDSKISEILDSSGLTWIKMCSLTLIQTKNDGSLKYFNQLY